MSPARGWTALSTGFPDHSIVDCGSTNRTSSTAKSSYPNGRNKVVITLRVMNLRRRPHVRRANIGLWRGERQRFCVGRFGAEESRRFITRSVMTTLHTPKQSGRNADQRHETEHGDRIMPAVRPGAAF